MAGIYIHIPFCKSKCIYCDFYSGTQFHLKDDFIKSLLLEIESRKQYIGNESINTIYFGGGTPSLLSKSNLTTIFNSLYKNYSIHSNPEITMECNPDNLDSKVLYDFNDLGINRLSIGTQSFNNQILKFFNRLHSAECAFNSVLLAQESGFSNISLDFIYNVPGLSDEILLDTLQKVEKLQVQHLSFYDLTVSEKTKLYWYVKNQKVVIPGEHQSLNNFFQIYQFLKEAGFHHYEISNYAKPGFESLHNSNYWNQVPYIGFGPSAHSYNIHSRQWNISSLIRYNNYINRNLKWYEIECLTDRDKYNDYIVTNLRTYHGFDLYFIKNQYDEEIFNHFNANINLLHSKGFFYTFDGNKFLPSIDDLLKADYIAKYLII